MRRTVGLAVAWAAILVVSCDSGPKAGEVVLELVTPYQDLGAVSFTVVAEEPNVIDTVTAGCSGCEVFTVRASDRQMLGVITGSLQAGPVLRLTVSDVDVPAAYSGRILQAANQAFELVPTAPSRLQGPQ